MRGGVYKASFVTPLGAGQGVITAIDGKISGGDSRSYYHGTYSLVDDHVVAEVQIERHTTLHFTPSVLGSNRATVQLDGAFVGDGAELSGFAVGKGLQRLHVTIRRLDGDGTPAEAEC